MVDVIARVAHNVLQLKKYITAEIWSTLKHKRNAKPTLIGAVDGGSGIIGSHVAKLILYTSLSLVCISNRNQRCLRKKLSFTTASAIISYFARKGELLFTNSDQIEADDYANFQWNNMFRFSSPPSHEDESVRLAKNWEKLEGLG